MDPPSWEKHSRVGQSGSYMGVFLGADPAKGTIADSGFYRFFSVTRLVTLVRHSRVDKLVRHPCASLLSLADYSMVLQFLWFYAQFQDSHSTF